MIAPSRSSSLRRTTSMTDLGKEFKSALRRDKDAQPGLGFGLGLAGAVMGEGSPVTVSSGPRSGAILWLHPHPMLVVLVHYLCARSLRLQYRMMPSCHPVQGVVANNPPSILRLLPLS